NLKFAEAIAELRRLLAERPRSSAWLMQLAELALSDGEYDLAIDTFRKLIARDDLEQARETYYRGLIQAQLLLKDYDGAIASTLAWLAWQKSEPAKDNIRLAYLQVLGDAGRAETALAEAEKWLESQPNNPAYRQFVISQLAEMKRYDEAAHLAMTWLAEKPKD